MTLGDENGDIRLTARAMAGGKGAKTAVSRLSYTRRVVLRGLSCTTVPAFSMTERQGGAIGWVTT